MNIKDRVLFFIENKGIKVSEFEKRCGLSNGYVSSMRKGFGAEKLNNVLNTFPELNRDWLLYGEGEMLKDLAGSNASHRESRYVKANVETRPRIPYDAAAGSLSMALDGVTSEECEQVPIIPSFPQYDFTIYARGDSMTPDFMSGDELACAFVIEQTFIQWGRPHILDTAQGIVLKKIFPRADSILCRSVNSDYPDFEVPKSDIYHMALVVGLIRHL